MRVSKRIVAEQFVPTSTTPPSDVGIYRVNRKALGVTGRIDTFDTETKVLSSLPQTLLQTGVPFAILPGDGGSNGLNFTGIRGVFTLSAAAPMANSVAFLRACYIYLPANAGGLASGGWYWCQMSDDTNGEVFAETYTSGKPMHVASPTSLPNLTSGRITQTTSEVTGISITMPGGSMGPSGILRAVGAVRYTNSATTKGMRIKLNGNSFGYASGTTTNGVIDFDVLTQNQGVANKQLKVSANIGRSHLGAATMASTDATAAAENTENDLPITQTLYLGATTDAVISMLRQVVVQYSA